MKKIMLALVAILIATPAFAQLNYYQPGPRLIDGNQLNLMVDQVNNLTGHGTAGPISGTNLTLSGNITVNTNKFTVAGSSGNTLVAGTLAVTGVTTFAAVPVAPAGGITLGSTTFTEAALGLYAKGVAAGYKVARGETALDGTNPTPVTPGLATIVACSASIKTASAPGLSTSVVTYDVSTTTLNLYGWKPTGSGDTTLVASTGTDTIGWVCVGT